MKTLTPLTIQDQALKYLLVDGFSVIPVGKDKRPLISSWKPYQTAHPTEAEVKAWFKQYPEANIGIVTGKISNITVVDIDIHKGADAGPFPETYTVRTGNGGLQLYYEYAEGLSVSANAYPQFPHVDIRSDGGYVVAPPSLITPSTEIGKSRNGLYTIERAGSFTPFPTELFGKAKKKIHELVEVSAGDRNQSLTSLIGSLIRGRPKEKINEVYAAVVAINKTYIPPLPDKELKTTWKSIVTKELKRQSDIGEAVPSPIQISSTERIDISLRRGNNNAPFKDMANALMVLRQHPKTRGKIRYNEFKQEIEYNGEPFEDRHVLELMFLMQSDVKIASMSKESVFSAVEYYAHENRYDEAKDWLGTLRWDGTKRLEEWLITSCKLEDTAYHRAIASQWFLGLVRRLLYPGTLFDYVLVVVGPQGIGKTSMFRILGGPWYKSYTGAVDNKDFYITLRGAAILDLDEGVALYRSDSIKIKSIITETKDEYRAPYDRVTKKYPRRFVFSMSTNDTEPFRDVTGNRRYWVVDLEESIDFKWLEENREQLFAEAVYAIKNNVKYQGVEMKDAFEKQEEHLPGDEWAEPIIDFVRSSTLYCEGSDDYMTTITEIYEEAIKSKDSKEKYERLERRQEIRIGNVLRKDLGLLRVRVMVDKERKYRYVIANWKKKELRTAPVTKNKDELDKFVEEATNKF